jgi:hypothetical protein
MSIACDPASLISGAACLECGIPPGMEKSIIISLLCKIANMNCNATSLIAGAACLECGIPPGMQDAVTNYLLCQIANNGGGITNSASYPLADSVPLNVNFAHGLSSAPTYLHLVLVCTTSDSPRTHAGEEVEMFSLWGTTNSAGPFGASADGTNIFLSYDGTAGVNTNIATRGNVTTINSFSNFSLKVYYHA